MFISLWTKNYKIMFCSILYSYIHMYINKVSRFFSSKNIPGNTCAYCLIFVYDMTSVMSSFLFVHHIVLNWTKNYILNYTLCNIFNLSKVMVKHYVCLQIVRMRYKHNMIIVSVTQGLR